MKRILLDSIGQYDPETLLGVCVENDGCIPPEFTTDLLLTFTSEAIMAHDEYNIVRDRFGRTLSQPMIVMV